jgi:hypothetical protein
MQWSLISCTIHHDGDRIHVVMAGTSTVGRRTTDSVILLKGILSGIFLAQAGG